MVGLECLLKVDDGGQIRRSNDNSLAENERRVWSGCTNVIVAEVSMDSKI